MGSFCIHPIACAFFILCGLQMQANGADDANKILIASWKNQLGSTMTISSIDSKTGQISGNYKSPSGAGETSFPLIGWVNQSPPETGKDNVIVISFSVRWGEYGSITTWNGYLRTTANGISSITGQWILSRANSEFPWDHLIINQDIFYLNK